MLNAINAAHQIAQLNLSTETVFWGHSQGGHSALWSGILAPKYYPKLSVKGIAAAAPATDLAALFGAADLFNPSRTFLAYIVAAYSLIYPDVIWSDLVVTPEPDSPTFQALKVCVAGQPHADLPDPILKPNYINTAFGERLKQNTPLFPISAPILIGQGVQDKSVPLNMQEHFVQQFNAVIHAQTHDDHTKSNASHRPKLEFRVYPEEDHISLVTNPNNTFASDLFNFTKSLLN
jgi:pimeloyl-ACP methyl ester carboxylesterase